MAGILVLGHRILILLKLAFHCRRSGTTAVILLLFLLLILIKVYYLQKKMQKPRYYRESHN